MNLFWSVYKNLEKEVISLSDILHFDDNQSKIYSIHIASLLIRTAVEIESISKHLYEKNGGNMYPTKSTGEKRDLMFDSDCIQLLDDLWHITKKVVNVVSPTFYFSDKKNLILVPLENCNKKGKGNWKKAYQAVKHDREKSLTSGNIENLLSAMAALYLLNIYNMDDKISDVSQGDTFCDWSIGSSLFSVNVYRATSLTMGIELNDSNIISPPNSLDECVLIDKYTDNTFHELYKNHILDSQITIENVKKSLELKAFLEKHPDYAEKKLSQICLACGEEIECSKLGVIFPYQNNISQEIKKKIKESGINMVRAIISTANASKFKSSKRELVLNKHKNIYPSLSLKNIV